MTVTGKNEAAENGDLISILPFNGDLEVDKIHISKITI